MTDHTDDVDWYDGEDPASYGIMDDNDGSEVRYEPDFRPQGPGECPLCGGPTKLKNGRYGPFYGCLKWPECQGSRSHSAAHTAYQRLLNALDDWIDSELNGQSEPAGVFTVKESKQWLQAYSKGFREGCKRALKAFQQYLQESK